MKNTARRGNGGPERGYPHRVTNETKGLPAVTLHTFRRRQPVTEVLDRAPDWDASTIPFRGASDIGVAATEPITRIAPEPPPRQPADAAIFIPIYPLRMFGLLCGMDLWRRHTDPEAAHYRNQFDALRVSALRAGWHVDLYGRWCCKHCADEPTFTTSKPFAHWHAGVPHCRSLTSREHQSREHWQRRPVTEYHADAAAAFVAGAPAAEFWMRVEAELQVRERTADFGWHARHAAGAR